MFHGRGRLVLWTSVASDLRTKPNSAFFILCVQKWCSETLRTDHVLYLIWVKKKKKHLLHAVQVCKYLHTCKYVQMPSPIAIICAV